MKRLRFVIVICLISLSMASFAQEYHKARVTLRVLDEGGRIVPNAIAEVTFSTNISKDEGWGTRSFSVEGLTDTNGVFTAEAKGNPTIYYGAKKDGYYRTLNLNFAFTNAVQGCWQPWNPIVPLVLRKIGNQVPMYAKSVEKIIPVFNEPVGFDLEKSDWIIPYGKGSVNDVSFGVFRRVKTERDFDAVLTVRFSRKGDGIQEIVIANPRSCALRLPAEAPLAGYCTNVVAKWGCNPSLGGTYGSVGDYYNPNYLFRVRSEVDDKGNVIRAQYGKIHGAFRVSGILCEKSKLTFTYYLNPTPNDRNLEFDPSKNLFKDLKNSERVSEP